MRSAALASVQEPLPRFGAGQIGFVPVVCFDPCSADLAVIDQPLGKPMQLVGANEVHLADQNCFISCQLHHMCKGWNIAAKGGAVIPCLCAGRIAPCHECHAGGNADRRCAISSVEGHAVSSKPFHIWRAHDRVAVNGRKARGMLIRHHQDDVGLFGLLGGQGCQQVALPLPCFPIPWALPVTIAT